MQTQINNAIHSVVDLHGNLLSILNEIHSEESADNASTSTWFLSLTEEAREDLDTKMDQAFLLMRTLKKNLIEDIFKPEDQIHWPTMGDPIFQTTEKPDEWNCSLYISTGETLLITFSDFTMTITYNCWEV